MRWFSLVGLLLSGCGFDRAQCTAWIRECTTRRPYAECFADAPKADPWCEKAMTR